MDRSGATDRLHLIIVLRIVLHRPEEGDPDEEAAHDSTDISLFAAIEHRIDRLIALFSIRMFVDEPTIFVSE